MRILVIDPKKKRDQNPKHQYTFYEVLQVLYYFIDEESKFDKGKTLEAMNKIKPRIVQLATDLANLALDDNWYDISKIKKGELKALVDYDKEKGYFFKKKTIK